MQKTLSVVHFSKPISLIFFVIGLISISNSVYSQPQLHESPIAEGWAQNSVNAPIFRRNSVISDGTWQFVSYYHANGHLVLAKRKLGQDNWEIRETPFTGNVQDAHNTISMMLDGSGFLHISWDHHNNPLHYTRSLEPLGLIFPESAPAMIGDNEAFVSYPEFYQFSNGDLLFVYRDGGSGNGNLVMNRYHLSTKTWERLQTNLIDGQSQRNAYWQICLDTSDTIHVSWVWRENPNVSSNHDLSYARSSDGGKTWQKSDGTDYSLPISIQNAEVIQTIPQHSNLINQTSMATDSGGNPYIVTYYRETDDAITQFHVIYQQDQQWHHATATRRTLDFELEGIGSRSIPISRPQLLIGKNDSGNTVVTLIYRDEEYGNQVCATQATLPEFEWKTSILFARDMGRWEPGFDSNLWQNRQVLNLFLQTVGQGQAETLESIAPTMVSIMECKW